MRLQAGIAFSAFTIAALTATSASGLTCAPPDPVETIQWEVEQGKAISAIHGTLTIEINSEEGFLSGIDITTGQFFSKNIPILTTCFGPWCAEPLTKTITNALFILTEEKASGHMLLELNACGGKIFPNPSEEVRSGVSKFLSS